ncbi:MAG: restriction endonuclease subunit S domain-containing protein [Armatimonadota bacterium]
MLITSAVQDDPRFLDRADPAYWHPAYETLLAELRFPCQPLGDFITHITYGPIITGDPPPRAEGPAVAVVNQGQVGAAGVDLRGAVTVPPDCPWDLPRARLQAEDLVVCRSGAGSVAKNRLAVYLEEAPAVVGSFVDLVRVEGLDPFYTALYLKTSYGWGQVHRLINGVATPNISFAEIRALQIAVPPESLQSEIRQAYLDEVWPRHRALDPEAAMTHRRLVERLETQLSH